MGHFEKIISQNATNRLKDICKMTAYVERTLIWSLSQCTYQTHALRFYSGNCWVAGRLLSEQLLSSNLVQLVRLLTASRCISGKQPLRNAQSFSHPSLRFSLLFPNYLIAQSGLCAQHFSKLNIAHKHLRTLRCHQHEQRTLIADSQLQSHVYPGFSV